MRPSAVLLRAFAILAPIALISTIYLYFYPVFLGCGFPRSVKPPARARDGSSDDVARDFDAPKIAPFRLLALGDPQLEGDSSFPDPLDPQFRGWQYLRILAEQFKWQEIIEELEYGYSDIKQELALGFKSLRKSLDLLGNDIYLAHIYRTMHWWSEPTHVTILGDLLGSQWIDDEEFYRRSDRFWNRVFRGATQIEPELLGYKDDVFEGGYTEVLGADPQWNRRSINLVGNHDIGYAGDLDERRVNRFERVFGPVNGEILFTLPPSNSTSTAPEASSEDTPNLRIILLNSMNLDSPAFIEDLQSQTHSFVNKIISTSSPVESTHYATLLLTHIPLHKEAGICMDDPMFTYFPEDNGEGVKEQNMISVDMSRDAILQGIFGKSPDEEAAAGGMGRNGLILTGHDHEGCDVWHFADREDSSWRAARWESEEAKEKSGDGHLPGLREVTVRSMMGDFGGNAALVSAWWDEEAKTWRFEVANCEVGVQHIWWAIHVVDLFAVGLLLGALVCLPLEAILLSQPPTKRSPKPKALNPRLTKIKRKAKSRSPSANSHTPRRPRKA